MAEVAGSNPAEPMILLCFVELGLSPTSTSCHLIFIDIDVRGSEVEAISKSPIQEGGGASLPDWGHWGDLDY